MRIIGRACCAHRGWCGLTCSAAIARLNGVGGARRWKRVAQRSLSPAAARSHRSWSAPKRGETCIRRLFGWVTALHVCGRCRLDHPTGSANTPLPPSAPSTPSSREDRVSRCEGVPSRDGCVSRCKGSAVSRWVHLETGRSSRDDRVSRYEGVPSRDGCVSRRGARLEETTSQDARGYVLRQVYLEMGCSSQGDRISRCLGGRLEMRAS